MAKHNETGKKGEKLAQQHLRESGYEILEINWRYSRVEIDVIARDEQADEIVFVEVKTRSSNVFGYPEVSVTPKKQQNLIRAAIAYMEANHIEKGIRFDVLSVTIGDKKEELYHIKDAFFPGY